MPLNHLTSWYDSPVFHSLYQPLAFNDIHIYKRFRTSPESQDIHRAKPTGLTLLRLASLSEKSPKTSFWVIAGEPGKTWATLFPDSHLTFPCALTGMEKSHLKYSPSLSWRQLKPPSPCAILHCFQGHWLPISFDTNVYHVCVGMHHSPCRYMLLSTSDGFIKSWKNISKSPSPTSPQIS